MKKYTLISLAAIITIFFCVWIVTKLYAPKVNISETHNVVNNVTTNYYQDDFESYVDFNDLFSKDGSKWHNFENTNDSNYIEIVNGFSHSGAKSLKMHSTAYDGENASKASLKRYGLNFKEGDEVWYSAWYYLEDSNSSTNLFIFDLEDEDIIILGKHPSPGRRLYLGEKNEIISDLGKWFTNDVFYQKNGGEISFPKDEWVHVVMHMKLDQTNGLMEVWQNNMKVLEKRGITIPREDVTYNRLEVGITANGNKENAQTLYIDDVEISPSPLK